jgi:quinoprotein glucose dehydrogenase
MMQYKAAVSLAALTIALTAAAPAFAADAPKYRDWSAWGGSQDTMQYSDLKQVTKANVNNLAEVFRIDVAGQVASPIVVGSTIYGVGDGGIFAVDGVTGKKLWHNKEAAPVGRGVGMYWQSKDGKDKRIIYYTGLGFAELNAVTGEKITGIGVDGVVDMREGLDRDPKYLRAVRSGNPGRVFGDLVILGSAPGEGYNAAPGDIRAWNIRTGKMEWIFHTVPRPGEYGYDTWGKTWNWKAQGAANAWGELTLDEKNGIIFIPTGTGTTDFVSGDHPGNSLFSSSLLALDAKTGKRLWHFQTVHHDLWDYDNVTGPKLLNIKVDGTMVEAVALAGKTGFIYTFERKTGKPIWPIEERPVPQTNVPLETTSPTQPFPTKPEPFAGMTYTAADIGESATPEARAEILRILPTLRNEGIFTPPSIEGSLQMPGNHGGGQYGTVAVDPKKGLLYVTSVEAPAVIKLVPRKQPARTAAPVRGASVAGALDSAEAGGGPPQQAGGGSPTPGGAPPPPRFAPLPIDPSVPEDPSVWMMRVAGYKFVNASYGFFFDGRGTGQEPAIKVRSYLTAYDMNEGKQLWRVPFGNSSAAEALGLKDTGVALQKRTITLTASNLLFSVTGDRKFRAFDASDGAVLMERPVSGAGASIPAMYESKGKQYVLVTVGPGGRPGAADSAAPGSYIVYALPSGRR